MGSVCVVGSAAVILWRILECVFAAVLLSIGLWVAARRWNRDDPIPMPYFMRWVLLLPRGPHSPEHLMAVLGPRSGERILELGPGVGVHAVTVAAALAPGGVLDAFDLQHEMLVALRRRAMKTGVKNILATEGDARSLPYARHAFDAAYLITALGEVADERAALREVRRVLKPHGRLVIGEWLVDPDYISLSVLEKEARDAGLALERTTGPRFCYFAVFHPSAMAGLHGEQPWPTTT